MRILIAHSRYMTGSVSGENRVVDDDVRLLRDAGHEVTLFDPGPVHPEKQGPADLVRTSADIVWARGAVRKMRRLIGDNRPDVVHLHNLIPMLSPAVVRAIDGEGVPAVMSLHNYRLFCLPATLERDGAICELCLGHLPWQGVRFGCYRDSRAASAVVAASLGLHRGIGTFSRLRLMLPVSRFVLETYRRAGFDARRMSVRPNFAWPAVRREGPGDYFLYAGRLAREKGVDTLLEAWRPSLGRLLIAGSGPEEPQLRASAPPGVEFIGAVEPARLNEVMANARALVVPSIWFETSGRVIMEAAATGVPVVASRIGGIPEAVDDGRSGILVAPRDAEALGDALARLTEERAVGLGQGAYHMWQERHSPERALANLEEAYAVAIG